MSLLRKIRTYWFPSSILLALILCWYLVHLVNNTPGISAEHEEYPERFPEAFGKTPDLRIIVLAYNRSESLQRLLQSLESADYHGDLVTLDIWIDRSENGAVHGDTVKVARKFNFKSGEKNVYIHGQHQGVLGQWIRNYKLLENPKEICIILEDDLSVSSNFYTWLKLVHKTYRDVDSIIGFTLQGIASIYSGQNVLERVNVSEKYPAYLYCMPGTWGFSPKPQQWNEFIAWYEKVTEDKQFSPMIPNNILSVWYTKSLRRGDKGTLWSILLSYYNQKFGKFILYPNLQPKYHGFSFNWKEKGVNNYGHAIQPYNSDLVKEWSPTFEELPKNPPTVLTNGSLIVKENTNKEL